MHGGLSGQSCCVLVCMKCLLRYPVGKSRMLGDLAPYLAGMLKDEPNYGEPFTGGGSVALYVARHFPGVTLYINDKDPIIAGLWRVICGGHAGIERLCDMLDVKPTVDMWHSVNTSSPTTDVERAFKAIFMNRTSWNGIIHGSRPIGGLEQRSQWSVDCRYTVKTLISLVWNYHRLLVGRTKVSCLDAEDFLLKYPFPCYVDPPYLMTGKNTLYGVTMTEAQHQSFAKRLRSVKKWVLTYDMKDEIACNLYWGAQKSLIDTRYSMDTAHSAHRKVVHVAEWKKASEICAWKGFSPI